MATGGGAKSAAYVLLLVNLVLFFIVTVIAAWAMNHGIERSRETGNHFRYIWQDNQLYIMVLTLLAYLLHNAASVLSIPLRIFPIYFPMGNMGTGFFVIFSLIAGVVGIATSLNGLHNVFQWDAPSLHTAAASSLVSWSLTLLSMG